MPSFTPASAPASTCQTASTASTPSATYAKAAAPPASSTEAVATATVSTATAVLGCVKWFINKAGYGFITVSDPTTREIFVHHSSIQVNQSQYRYLVQGEYVELAVSSVENDTHEFQAANVRGVNGGKLMCETRNEMRSERQQHTSVHEQAAAAPAPVYQQQQQQQQQRPRQVQSSRPQLSENDQTEWMIVPKRQTNSRPRQEQQQRGDSRPSRGRATGTSTSSGSSNSGARRPQQRQPTVELAE